MAQADRSLSSAFIPENTEKASESPRVVPRYIIGLPSGLFVADCADDVLTETPRRSEAKIFWSKRRAIVNAEIFNGEVLAAETALPAQEPFLPSKSDPDRSLSPLEVLATCIAEQSGCKFLGILRGHRKHKPLILFCAANVPKELQTTMALPVFEFSVQNIRKRAQETIKRYGHAWSEV